MSKNLQSRLKMQFNKATMIANGKLVISKQIDGLTSMIEIVDDNFAEVVERIVRCQGKVITVGVGKSGVIAQKFAATLSSTGTPAIFLHPVEAVHGDLGIISEKDIVVFLSNSGETFELVAVLEYCKRLEVKTIGICRNKDSYMFKTCDYNIVLPAVPEATSIPAPTTSTTMMLCMCDAIAVAVFESKGFTTLDFKLFHPGGSIGAKLTEVSEIMHKGEEMPLVMLSSSTAEVVIEITKKRLGCVGVLDDNNVLIGLITDGDLRRHIHKDLNKIQISEIMTKGPKVLRPSVFAVEALNIMSNSKITNAFIVDEENRPLGILHIHDLLRHKVA